MRRSLRLPATAIALAAFLALQVRPVFEAPVSAAPARTPRPERMAIEGAPPLFAAPLPMGPAAVVWPPDNPAFGRICAALGLAESDTGYHPPGAERECIGEPAGEDGDDRSGHRLFATAREARGGRITVRLKLTVREPNSRETGRMALLSAAAPVLGLAGIEAPLRLFYLPETSDPLDLTIGRHRVRFFREAGEGEHYNLMLSLPEPPRPPFAEPGLH